MEEQARLEKQEKRLQFENSLRHHSEIISRLTAGSVRGMVTFDEMIIHSFESYLESLSEMMRAYPDGLDKLHLVQQLINLHQAFSLAGYEKHISNYKQLENHYLEKYNQMSSVLSALCSIALDNPDEDAYKIISEYKNSQQDFLLAFLLYYGYQTIGLDSEAWLINHNPIFIHKVPSLFILDELI